MTSIRIERLAAVDVSREPDSPYAACLEIRRIVFTEGQGVALALEFDGLDDEAEHFVAYRIDADTQTAVGTARMRRIDSKAKAERVAVVESARSTGVGRQLMRALEARARALGLDTIVLHAQIAVIPFYEKLGFVAKGEVFDEAGIEHRSMSKPLEP